MEPASYQSPPRPTFIANHPPLTITALIANAVLLCVPFTVLAFQSVRFDGYDPEKIELLGILVAIIVGVQVPGLASRGGQWLRMRRQSKHSRASITISPLLAAVAGLFVVAVISTAWSLSASLSFWGEPSRAQGLLALIFYLVLFLQATQLRRHLRPTLVLVLLITAVPMCLWTIIQFVQGTDRLLLGSSAGNPNFLSSWIVMVLLFSGPQLYRQQRLVLLFPPRHLRIFSFVLYLVPISLMLVCLLINASRGALLGLAGGIVFCFVVIAASARHRKWLISGGLGLLVLAAGYGAGSVWVRSAAGSGSANGLTRLFTPYDPVRVTVWGNASTIVALQAQPVFTLDRQPDSLALLRPVIGYGLETIEQLQSRVGKLNGLQISINSFHNVIFDTLITQGWLGLFTLVLFLECIFYVGLCYLSLLTSRQIGQWIIWQIGGAIAGIVVVLVVIPVPGSNSIGTLSPLGVGLGTVGGLLAWIGRQSFAARPAVTILADEQKTLVMAILAVVVAEWIDNQLGFAQGSTQPLWWMLIGLLAAIVYQSPTQAQVQSHVSPIGQPSESVDSVLIQPPITPAAFCPVVVLIAGLFVIHSFGSMLSSALADIETGSQALTLLLVALLIVGLIGGQSEIHKNIVSVIARMVLYTVTLITVWGSFWAIKLALVTLSSTRLDTAIRAATDPNLSEQFVNAIRPLSIHGIALAVVAVVIMVVFLRLASQTTRPTIDQQRMQGTSWRRKLVTVALVAVTVFAACWFYSGQYTSGVLHNLGNSTATRAQVVANSPNLAVATAAFEGAAVESPMNMVLRLHWAMAIAVRVQVTLDPPTSNALHSQLQIQLATIFRDQPYFVNTIEWLNYAEHFGSR